MLQTLNVHPVQVFLVGLLSGKYAGSYVGQLRQGKDEVARRVNVARFRNSRITADRKYVLSDNVYTVTGNSNHFECASTAGQDKTVDSRLGASVSATAAASQQGAATNSGSSESSAIGGAL